MSATVAPDFDLVVVGGGHNGLVCAAYVAAAGYRVALLEREARIGGAAVTEEFHPGFRNSAASYTVSLLQPRVIADLELERHGLRILNRPLENFVPAPSGPGLALPATLRERQAAIAEHSALDAERYRRFSVELEAVSRLLRPMLLDAPVDFRAGTTEWIRAGRLAARLLRAGPGTLRRAARLVSASAGHWLDDHFETDLLKGALGFDAVVGHFASPYESETAYVLLHHTLGEVNGRAGAWGHAVGGMGAVSDALARSATARGAVIVRECAVEKIDADGGSLVVTAGARRYRSRAVAAGVHPQTLFLTLVDRARLPEPFEARIRSWRSESASFRINVALSELPRFSCLTEGRMPAAEHGAGILLTPSLGYLDAAHATAKAHGWSTAPVIELVIPSVLDDTLAPRGAHVASLFCQHFRYELPDGRSWAEEREAAISRVIDTVTEYAPNFRRSVLGLRAYSPVDLESRFGLVGGDIFHGAMVPEQLYWSRPARGFARYRTPIPHLYLCGSGAHPGGGVSGAPGHNAAQAILQDWRAAAVRSWGGAARET